MFFVISFPNFVSGLTVIVSTRHAVLSIVLYRRGGIVPTYKSKIENEKERRVFVLGHYLPPPLNDDRDNYSTDFYIISFRIADIMES